MTGVILAGGAGRRMGGADKGLLPFAGRPLIEWVIEVLAPQVGGILISANRNLTEYAAYGFPVVEDARADFQGPLAGILGAMRAAPTPYILTLPCDAPHPPTDLRDGLARALMRDQADLSLAVDGQRRHSVHALLPVKLVDDLDAFLTAGERKVELWQARHRVAYADFSDRPECFVNLNSAEELLARERELLTRGQSQ